MDDIIVDPPQENQIVDPMSWFDSPGPFEIEIEIGCGKGGFLLSRARANPHLFMLGIEWANKYLLFCADRIARWKLTNVRVMRTDAKFFVVNHLPPACVSMLHLYHPDPWPKRRHYKRRIVQPDFVEAAVRVLEPGGHWLIQSDHEEYFGVIRGLLDPHPQLAEVAWQDVALDLAPGWTGTNYEIKYTREGRRIHRAAYRRV
jgi:tRNA (guanine-N7-)-methyltransferase